MVKKYNKTAISISDTVAAPKDVIWTTARVARDENFIKFTNSNIASN